MPGLFFVAAALPELAAELQPALAAMVRAELDGPVQQGTGGAETGLTLALAARYQSCTVPA